MEERKRLAEEFLLTPDIILQNKKLRMQSENACAAAEVSSTPMLIMRHRPLLLLAASTTLTCIILIIRGAFVAKVCLLHDVSRMRSILPCVTWRVLAAGNPFELHINL